VVAVAGCGGSRTETNAEAPGPKIERATAERLADLSDGLAGHLESGNSCAASQTAARLRAGVTQAIADGKVPDAYLEDLSGLANELEFQTPKCVEPPPPSDDDEDGKGKKKEKKKHEEDTSREDDDGETPAGGVPIDPEIPTTEIPTTADVTTEPTLTVPTTTEEDR
jgi:hypothetical protein